MELVESESLLAISKLLARDPNQTHSKVTEHSKKGTKKALETAIIDDAENILPNLPTEALPAPSKVKRTRKALTE